MSRRRSKKPKLYRTPFHDDFVEKTKRLHTGMALLKAPYRQRTKKNFTRAERLGSKELLKCCMQAWSEANIVLKEAHSTPDINCTRNVAPGHWLKDNSGREWLHKNPCSPPL